MFNNIGGKIKTLTAVCCWIGIIASVITGIILMCLDEDLILFGILTATAGPLFIWLGSFFSYGFGQLVENSDILAGRQQLNVSATGTPAAAPKVSADTFEKMEKLNKWRAEGLITEEEYAKKIGELR